MKYLLWMLEFIPNWFWHLLLIVGFLLLLISWFLKMIPFVGTNRLLIQIVGTVAFVIGIFYQGVIFNDEKWQVKIQALEEKLAKAQEESGKVNVVVKKEYVEVVKTIKGKTEYITQYIDREVIKKEEVIKFVENCPIPKQIIETHNLATEKDLSTKESEQ